jgi:hypothetical protein
MSLVEASRMHLEVIEHSPLSAGGFEHPNAELDEQGKHWCSRIVSCSQLTDLSISLPTVCPELFNDHYVQWKGDVHLRAAGICGLAQSLESTESSWMSLTNLLEACRSLIAARRNTSVNLNVEIYICK